MGQTMYEKLNNMAIWRWNDDEQAWFCSNCKACLEKEDVQRHYFEYCYHCGKHMKIEQDRWRRDENIPTLYECDPEKNIYCSKESCCINGGKCHETTCIEFEKKNEDIIDALCQVGEGYPITKEEIEHGTDIKTEKR